MRISDWSSDVCSSDLIEARFGLEPDLVDRLRAENILYDRDAAGEYFQIYSPNYGDGFFFEIIERRGYHGYGAPNAPFRIAAQKRGIHARGPLEIGRAACRERVGRYV